MAPPRSHQLTVNPAQRPFPPEERGWPDPFVNEVDQTGVDYARLKGLELFCHPPDEGFLIK
jgi:hypothetical protein